MKSILNKENKIWNTNESLDGNWNTGGPESISKHVLSYREHWLMRTQHKMICQPSCRISAVKIRGVREGNGGKEGGREEKEDRKKNAKRGNKSSIELELSNFRYHRNCFRDFSNKLQINPAKNPSTIKLQL